MLKLLALIILIMPWFTALAQGKPSSPVVLVTGAFSGLGLEISQDLLERGYRVAMAGRDLSKLPNHESMVGGENAFFVHMNMGDTSSIAPALDKIYARFGRLDAVVHNAAQVIQDEGPEVELASLRRSLEVNFLGAAELTNLSMNHFRRLKFGRIIYLSSAAAVMAQPGMAAYSASKAAAEAYFQTIALELDIENRERRTDIEATVLRIGVVRGNYVPTVQIDQNGTGRAVSVGLMKRLRSLSPTTPATVSNAIIRTIEKDPENLVRLGWDGKMLSAMSFLPPSLISLCSQLLTPQKTSDQR